MSQFDLTPKLAPNLDMHLILPLLDFLQSKKIYSEKDVLTQKYAVLKSTKKFHQLSQVSQALGTSFALAQEQTAFNKILEQAKAEGETITKILSLPDVAIQLKGEKIANMKPLHDHGFKPEMVNSLFKLAKLEYESGNYTKAAEMLHQVRLLSTDQDLLLNALWGKLAAEILIQNWEVAMNDLNLLKDTLDQRSSSSHLFLLQQRTWVIHWSLFIFFNHPKGRDGIIDVLLQPNYQNTIQMACPWILRYLTCAVIVNKKRRSVLKELTRIIQAESVNYRDPVTEFAEALYVSFDFELAKNKLRQCEEVLSNDYFLTSLTEDFVENARLFIFETYCRIHQRIDIAKMSEMLNLEKESGEKWIVNLIRNARLDAKIDAQTNTVIMGTSQQSVYQQVIERTKAVGFRSSMLVASLEKRKADLLARQNGLQLNE